MARAGHLGMGARPLQDSAKKRLIAYHEVAMP